MRFTNNGYLGQYEAFVDSATDRKNVDMLSFTFGALIGLAVFSRILSWLLNRHPAGVIAIMLGIMIGSLRRV